MANLADEMKKASKMKKDGERRAEKEKKLSKKQKEKAEKRKNKMAIADEKKAKSDLAKKVKVSLSKIMEVYHDVKGDYINENGVELMKDKEGNIMGMVDGFAFVSDSEGTITFYSKPVQGDSYYYFIPLHDDNYQYWFDYDEVPVKLGAFKLFSVKPEDIKFKTARVCEGSSYPPKQDRIDEVYNKLQYVKIEKAVSSMRNQRVKR